MPALNAAPAAPAAIARRPTRTTLCADFRVTVRAAETPGVSAVEAWLVVQGTARSARCLVVAEGFDDGWHFGAHPIRCSFSAASPGRWQRRPGGWRWALSSWRGPDDGAQAAADWMRERFAGIKVQVRLQPVGV